MRTRVLPLALGLCLVACPREPYPSTSNEGKRETPSETSTKIEPLPRQAIDAAPESLRARVRALGDRGTFVVVLRDEGWADALDMTGLSVDAAPNLASPEALLRYMAQAVEIPMDPVPLAGRDPARPIVASLLETSSDLQIGRTVELILELKTASFSGLRHQISIPASDRAALVESLAGAFAAGRRPWPKLVAGRPGAKAFRMGDGFVAILPEAESETVRVVVVHTAARLGLDEHRAQLDAVPVEPRDTPALRQLGAAGPLAFLLRPHRLRDEHRALAIVEMTSLLSVMPPGQEDAVLERGIAIALDDELMRPEAGAELDEWAGSLWAADGQIHARVVAGLTERGRRVVAAGHGDPTILPAVIADDVIGEHWVRGDLSAMLDASELLPEYTELSTKLRLDMWDMCSGCERYAVFHGPLTVMRSLLFDHPGLVALRDARLQAMKIVTLPPAEHGSRDRHALALVFSPGTALDAAPVVSMLRTEFRMPRAKQAPAVMAGTLVLLVGEDDLDPHTVFDLELPVATGEAFASARSELTNVLARLGIHSETPLDLGVVSGRVVVSGPAVVIDMVVGDDASLGPVVDFGDLQWPALESASSPGWACMFDAGVRGRRIITNQAAGDDVDKLDTSLRCAEADPATADDAARLRRVLAR